VEPASVLADCVDGVDFVLEAVVEDVTVEREVFGRLPMSTTPPSSPRTPRSSRSA
jgi:3-hydroxyacyl-CoA dehydrogenase